MRSWSSFSVKTFPPLYSETRYEQIHFLTVYFCLVNFYRSLVTECVALWDMWIYVSVPHLTILLACSQGFASVTQDDIRIAALKLHEFSEHLRKYAYHHLCLYLGGGSSFTWLFEDLLYFWGSFLIWFVLFQFQSFILCILSFNFTSHHSVSAIWILTSNPIEPYT